MQAVATGPGGLFQKSAADWPRVLLFRKINSDTLEFEKLKPHEIAFLKPSDLGAQIFSLNRTAFMLFVCRRTKVQGEKISRM